jgi:hypothetical protein
MQTTHDSQRSNPLPARTTIGLVTDHQESVAIDRLAARVGRWPITPGWLVLALLILLQWALFRQFALREVVWAYPTYNDQVTYLSLSYETYEQILSKGLPSGLWHGLSVRVPNGIMIHLQASLLFLVIGASRFSALTLNFLYFALFQCALAGTLRWLTGRWSMALLGVGLLLTAATPFYGIGALMDFRIDFIAFCLYGIFICAVIRSGMFASWRWSLVVGVVAAVLVLFRFITLVYLGGVLGLVFLLLCLRWLRRRHDADARRPVVRRIVGLMIAGGVLLGSAGPAIWYNREPIQNYYVVGHLTGPDKELRAQQFGVFTTLDSLLFYPKSVLYDHAGSAFIIFSVLALVIALGVATVRAHDTARQSASSPLDRTLTYVFVGACLLVPLTVLTLNVSKSPVVGNILVPGLLWLVLISVVVFSRGAGTTHPLVNRVLAGLAALLLCAGIYNQVNMLSRHGLLTGRRAEVEQLLRFYDTIGQYSREFGWDTPRISVDTVADYLYPTALRPLFYERQGVLLSPRIRLGTVGPGVPGVTEAEALALLQDSDFVILTNTAAPRASIYPFEQSMEALRPKLLAFSEQAFIPLQRLHVFDRDVTLYIRPSLKIAGNSGGWLTSKGMTLTGSSTVLQTRPHIELTGQSNFGYLGGVPGVRAQLLLPDQAPRDIPASLVASGEDYRMTIDVSPEDLPAASPVQILVRFDRFFVPKEIGLNEDTRQLVIRTPSGVTLLP